jgi:hypothetical protein
MANSIAVAQLLSENSCASMHNELQFNKLIDRQLDSQWGDKVKGFKAGDTYRINRPAQHVAYIGNTIDGARPIESIVDDPIYVTLSTNDQRFVPMSFDSRELTLAVDDVNARYGDGAGLKLASTIEKKIIAETILKGGSAFITADSTKLQVVDALKAKSILDNLCAPSDSRAVLANSAAQAQLAGQNLTLFTPVQNSDVYVKGELGNFANADWYVSTLLPSYLPVPALTGVTVATAVTDGATSIALAGLVNNAVYKAGTVFTFTAFYRVNPETKDVTPYNYQFSLKADMTASGTGTGTAQIDGACAIYSATDAGNRQNISALPGVGAVITVLGSTTKTYWQSVMFAKEAYTGTIVPLIELTSGAVSKRSDFDGVSVRTMIQTQAGSDVEIYRFDAMAVGALLRDQYAVRILSEQ